MRDALTVRIPAETLMGIRFCPPPSPPCLILQIVVETTTKDLRRNSRRLLNEALALEARLFTISWLSACDARPLWRASCLKKCTFCVGLIVRAALDSAFECERSLADLSK
jgi:hypothetical protein